MQSEGALLNRRGWKMEVNEERLRRRRRRAVVGWVERVLRKEAVLGCTFVWEEEGRRMGEWKVEGGGGERRRRRGNEREGRVIQGRSCGQHPPPSPLSACPSQLPVLPELK